MTTTYLLDADVFISAKRLHYGFDFCPAFWQWLIAKNRDRRVFSIERVGSELTGGGDELSEWAKERGKHFFLPAPTTITPALTSVSDWVTAQTRFTPAATNIFFSAADYLLVAHALAETSVVVTRETPQPQAQKVKIPDVCIGLGIRWLNPFEMLRHERAHFVLGAPR